MSSRRRKQLVLLNEGSTIFSSKITKNNAHRSNLTESDAATNFFLLFFIFFCFSLHVLINAAPLAFDVMENDEIRFYKNNTYMHITIAAAATSSPPI